MSPRAVPAAAKPRLELQLELTVAAPSWRALGPGEERLRRRIRRAAEAALAEGAPGPVRQGAHKQGAGGLVSLSVLLAGGRRLQSLNRAFRQDDRTTDILAFPADERGPDGVRRLGDLALGLEGLRRTARGFGAGDSDQLAHLVIHGVLHLLGHEHGAPGPRARMRGAEARALARLGLPDPWQGEERGVARRGAGARRAA